jgi:hypothetical protein
MLGERPDVIGEVVAIHDDGDGYRRRVLLLRGGAPTRPSVPEAAQAMMADMDTALGYQFLDLRRRTSPDREHSALNAGGEVQVRFYEIPTRSWRVGRRRQSGRRAPGRRGRRLIPDALGPDIDKDVGHAFDRGDQIIGSYSVGSGRDAPAQLAEVIGAASQNQVRG